MKALAAKDANQINRFHSCSFAGFAASIFPDQRVSAQISGDLLREPDFHVGTLGQVNTLHKADFAAVARHHDR
jgi:hypothetical protein